MTVSLDTYFRVIENRPFKLDEEQVNYRPTDTEERCKSCIHLYRRVTDKFHVCELFRNEVTDEKGVDPEKVCDFWNTGDDEFPLLVEANEADEVGETLN